MVARRPLALLLVAGGLALATLAPAAAAYHEPATKPPPVDPADRPFYAVGANCLKTMGEEITAISRVTSKLPKARSLSEFTRLAVQGAGAAKHWERASQDCSRRLGQATPGTSKGRRAKPLAVQAFTLYARAAAAAGAAFRAYSDQKIATGGQLLKRTDRYYTEAGRMLGRSDAILRGKK